MLNLYNLQGDLYMLLSAVYSLHLYLILQYIIHTCYFRLLVQYIIHCSILYYTTLYMYTGYSYIFLHGMGEIKGAVEGYGDSALKEVAHVVSNNTYAY